MGPGPGLHRLDPQGYDIEFDANAQWGCKPTEALLLSLAACMGIDIVTILKKTRAPLTSFRMELTGRRNPAPPQYYRAVEIVLHLGGTGLEPAKVDRHLPVPDHLLFRFQLAAGRPGARRAL